MHSAAELRYIDICARPVTSAVETSPQIGARWRPRSYQDSIGIFGIDGDFPNRLPGKGGLDVNQEQATSNTEQALRKLVDEAADDVTKQLAAEVAQTATSMPMTSAHAPEAPTKTDTHVSTSVSKILFVGISEGLAYIDKGSEAGIKVGQKFTIRRSVDTGLKNGAGEPVIRHKAVCALTISTVEDSSAAGKCIPDPTAHGADGIPRTGDEVVAETR